MKKYIDKTWLQVLLVLLVAGFFLLFYFKFHNNGYLTFSDTAKFADLARNILKGVGYKNSFSFGTSNIFESQETMFPSPWIPPLMPFSIVLAFKIFGVSDITVLATSAVYFLLLIVFTYLLGKRIFGTLVGLLTAFALSANIDFLNYATNGASESLFCAEIIASTYFLSLRKKITTLVGFILMALMYFTRPQGFIYISGLILYWLLLNLKIKKAVTLFVIILVSGLLVDLFVLPIFAGNFYLYSVTGRGLGTATQVLPGGSASDSLRGLAIQTNTGLITLLKKVFYNLYNFYKLLPNIINPYIFALFLLSLIKPEKRNNISAIKIVTIFVSCLTLIVTAASIPFFRYIHPIVPLIYLVAIYSLVSVVSAFVSDKKRLTYLSFALIAVYTLGQTLGVIFLDSRFEKKIYNFDKPQVYVVLSKLLKEKTNPNDVVITNLDTWASWYGERTTIWFPADPKKIINPKNGDIPFDAIYLTSYLINDQNYFMDDSWHMIFDNPNNPEKWTCDGCSEIANRFVLKTTFSIHANDVYENKDATAILLVKKDR